MKTIETFASEAGVIICIERSPRSQAWTAKLTLHCSCGPWSIWLKETQQPPLAYAETARLALEHLTLLCRNKTLIINDSDHREVAVPIDLSVGE